MKKKILHKLQKKFEKLQLHHIDTSIVLEPEKSDDGRFCRKYLQLVGYKYRGKLSLPVFGEILLGIKAVENYTEQHDTLDLFLNLIKVRRIETHVPKKIEEITKRIREIDSRVDSTDAEILSCAIEDKANTFVTLDTKLIHNERLEKEFEIRIRHPSELIY